MKNLKTFEAWIADLREITKSSQPRSTLRALRTNKNTFYFRTRDLFISTQLEDLLTALNELRHTRCNGRIEYEKYILRDIQITCDSEVHFDQPDEQEDESHKEIKPMNDEVRAEYLKVFHLLANHCYQILLAKPQKTKDYGDLLQEVYTTLEILTYRPELEPLLTEILTLTRANLKKSDPAYAHAAIEYIDSYYYNFSKDQTTPEEVFAELDKIASKTKHESVLFAINNLFVNIGRISKLEGLDSMDNFREKN